MIITKELLIPVAPTHPSIVVDIYADSSQQRIDHVEISILTGQDEGRVSTL